MKIQAWFQIPATISQKTKIKNPTTPSNIHIEMETQITWQIFFLHKKPILNWKEAPFSFDLAAFLSKPRTQNPKIEVKKGERVNPSWDQGKREKTQVSKMFESEKAQPHLPHLPLLRIKSPQSHLILLSPNPFSQHRTRTTIQPNTNKSLMHSLLSRSL